MRLAPLLMALAVVASPLAADTARGQQANAPPAGRERHFVDFRARPGALWGHTFIVYGRVDSAGRTREAHRAGLYPDGGLEGLILGSVMPVPAKVGADDGDRTETPSAIYRRALSAAEFARLKAVVARLRDNERRWHLSLYNCNDFAGAVAQSLGMQTPPNFLVPNAWVRALRAMNQR